ncbi:MAG: Fic family protein [Alphaproteobacteria bacterium]|nr:Fic family protein [Alphaproteobacteria bacterium]
MAFTPRYTISSAMALSLGEIERARQAISDLPITARILTSLRDTARIASTHYSTAIEGNMLSAEEVRAVIAQREHFPNRAKDEQEVQNYYQALNYVEQLANGKEALSEKTIQTIHGIAYNGRKRPSPYRDDQNVIRNGKLVVYIPPKDKDVAALMKGLVEWFNLGVKEFPIPIVAGLAHYQLATIHPYFDGNGRTARLLATLVLHRHGYGLKGIYSLEEYYARNLKAYYDALTVGNDEDYYEGKRAEGDLTQFLEYFIGGMVDSFVTIQRKAERSASQGATDQSLMLRSLLPEQRQVLKLFQTMETLAVIDIAEFFKISDRQARRWCKAWTESGFLEIEDSKAKAHRYRLSEVYEALVLETISQVHENITSQ